jgi:hypothetical protein
MTLAIHIPAWLLYLGGSLLTLLLLGLALLGVVFICIFWNWRVF